MSGRVVIFRQASAVFAGHHSIKGVGILEQGALDARIASLALEVKVGNQAAIVRHLFATRPACFGNSKDIHNGGLADKVLFLWWWLLHRGLLLVWLLYYWMIAIVDILLLLLLLRRDNTNGCCSLLWRMIARKLQPWLLLLLLLGLFWCFVGQGVTNLATRWFLVRGQNNIGNRLGLSGASSVVVTINDVTCHPLNEGPIGSAARLVVVVVVLVVVVAAVEQKVIVQARASADAGRVTRRAALFGRVAVVVTTTIDFGDESAVIKGHGRHPFFHGFGLVLDDLTRKGNARDGVLFG